MKKVASIIMTILWLASSSIVCARTIRATSCSQADVQSAVDSASSGDTVVLPAGNSTWSQKVAIPDDKKITVSGAGSSATVITWTGDWEAVDLGKSGSRLTGIKIILPVGSKGYAVHVYGYGWRVDHCVFENQTTSNKMGVYVRGTSNKPDPTGLIDSCVFKNSRVYIQGDASLTAHHSWSTDYKLGSGEFVFVEDCIFERSIFGNSIDSQYGGNYVFRHNTVLNSHVEVHSAYNKDGSYRAGRLWEIYDNDFICNESDYAPFRLRGGTGVIYDNVVRGHYDDPSILLDNVRTYEGSCSTWPCRDQIGRGRDEWLWTDEKPFPPQVSDPAYAWNNVYSDTGETVKFKVINNCSNVLVEGRDFYNKAKPGYTPYPYPHPMRNEDSNEPDSPKNLRIAK